MLNTLAILFINIYQVLPKRRSYGVCKFEPTCSEYAKHCFQQFSFLKALKLTRDRLHRCDANLPKEIDKPPNP
ncbi:membrane protein insertion efficiency factor YidD [Fodinibius sp. Rm-B-1B1-1]|uniref:membrane protein insertion efficiency factor YidD n=1 Tax=Fodinibius alkaliphilus TaxID=3140241 RepID=UPI0038B3B6E1